MKRPFIIAIAALAIVFFAVGGNVDAKTYDFSLTPEMLDLSHNKAYTWGFPFEIGEDETITNASLSLFQINNWAIETDYLYVTLLDNPLKGNPSTGVKAYTDRDNAFANYFSGQGTYLFTFSDTNNTGRRQAQNPPENYSYSFTGSNIAMLLSYLATTPDSLHNTIGFGFDPDCRYYFEKIVFSVGTEFGGGQAGEEEQPPSIPEPGTFFLLGSGIVGLAFFRRFNRK